MLSGEYKPPSRPGQKRRRICEGENQKERENEQNGRRLLHPQSFLAKYSQHPLRFTLIMLFSSAAVLLGAVAVARAQTDFPTEASVPRNRPIPGNYTGALRPQIHFSPPQGFMNDPNGMFLDPTGVWHLYYQCELCPLQWHPHHGLLTLRDRQSDGHRGRQSALGSCNV